MAKKRVKKVSKGKVVSNAEVTPQRNKFRFIFSKLIFFAVLFVISFMFYLFSVEDFYVAMFGLFSILFGAIALTFLFALLILLFLQYLRAK